MSVYAAQSLFHSRRAQNVDMRKLLTLNPLLDDRNQVLLQPTFPMTVITKAGYFYVTGTIPSSIY